MCLYLFPFLFHDEWRFTTPSLCTIVPWTLLLCSQWGMLVWVVSTYAIACLFGGFGRFNSFAFLLRILFYSFLRFLFYHPTLPKVTICSSSCILKCLFILLFIYFIWVMFWGNSKKGGRVSLPQCEGLLLLYWGRAAGDLAFEEYVEISWLHWYVVTSWIK